MPKVTPGCTYIVEVDKIMNTIWDGMKDIIEVNMVCFHPARGDVVLFIDDDEDDVAAYKMYEAQRLITREHKEWSLHFTLSDYSPPDNDSLGWEKWYIMKRNEILK